MENRLYVGNLSYSTSDTDLQTLFAKAGAVKSVTLITDRDTGRSKGFAFVEIVSPCPVYYGRRNRLGEAIDELRYYRERTTVQNFAALDELDLALNEEIVVGKFVEKERPTFMEAVREQLVPKAEEAAARA